MTPEEQTLLVLKGIVSEQPVELQVKIKQCRQAVLDILRKNAEAGYMAFALIGAELAAKGTLLGEELAANSTQLGEELATKYE